MIVASWMTRCSGNCCNRANSATKRSAANWRRCVRPWSRFCKSIKLLRRDYEALVDATRIITERAGRAAAAGGGTGSRQQPAGGHAVGTA